MADGQLGGRAASVPGDTMMHPSAGAYPSETELGAGTGAGAGAGAGAEVALNPFDLYDTDDEDDQSIGS